MAVNEDIFAAMLRHDLQLFSVTEAELATIADFFRDVVFPDMSRRLISGNWRQQVTLRARLAYVRNAIQESGSFEQWRNETLQKFVNLGQNDSRAVLGILSEVTPVPLQWLAPAPTLIQAAILEKPFNGNIMGEWFDKLKPAWQTGLNRDFRNGIIQGQSIPQLARNVLENNLEAFQVGGITNTLQQARTIVRTGATLVTNRAKELTYMANDEWIKGVRYVATLDDRTSWICMDLHGEVFAIGEGERPPQHYNCRSTTSPVLRSWQEMGLPGDQLTEFQMASMNGQVIGMENDFNDFVNSMNPGQRANLLGPVRARLWEQGKFTDIHQMVGINRQPLTLKTQGFTLSGKDLKKIA